MIAYNLIRFSYLEPNVWLSNARDHIFSSQIWEMAGSWKQTWIQEKRGMYRYRSQCENFRIFLSFIFYVKSTFGGCTSSKSVIFVILRARKSAKILKNPDSEPLNVLNWQVLHFYNPQNWFHVKSAWQKISLNFHTVTIMTRRRFISWKIIFLLTMPK